MNPNTIVSVHVSWTWWNQRATKRERGKSVTQTMKCRYMAASTMTFGRDFCEKGWDCSDFAR